MGLGMMGTGGDGFGSDEDGRDGFQCPYPCSTVVTLIFIVALGDLISDY